VAEVDETVCTEDACGSKELRTDEIVSTGKEEELSLGYDWHWQMEARASSCSFNSNMALGESMFKNEELVCKAGAILDFLVLYSFCESRPRCIVRIKIPSARKSKMCRCIEKLKYFEGSDLRTIPCLAL
jgi:hypothetical protein